MSKDVKALTNEIEKLTSGRVRNAQKKLDDVTARLDKVRTEMTRLTVAIKTAERCVLLKSYHLTYLLAL